MKSRQPTHAGGVVYRMRADTPEFLLVTARRSPQEWVYPKGHIEAGELPEQTAVREVEEEAGVRATIIDPLGDIHLRLGTDDQIVRYFLMSTTDDVLPGEGRRAAWMSADEAVVQLAHAESRACLGRALDALTQRGDSRDPHSA